MSERQTSAAHRQLAAEAELAGDFVAAERELRQALDADRADGATIFALAEFLSRRGRYAEAESYYERLRAAFPNEPALLNSIAVLLSKTGRGEQAIDLWRQVHDANPKLAQPLVNIGVALRARGDATTAVASFEQALRVDPGLFDAHYQLGVTYYHAKQYEPALASIEAALRVRPNQPRAAVLLAQIAQAVCDWDRRDSAMPQLRREVEKALAGKPCAITPWYSLRLPFARAERKAIAAVASRVFEDAAIPQAPALQFSFAPANKDRLTIGYISGDFRNHPIGQLTAGLYRRHDRERFRIVAYPVKPPDDWGRDVLRDGVDSIVDLSDMTDVEAARRIYADGADILVDISGFNTFMRPQILAFRPAPVQVSYLNFAGTLSARLYDYLIGDRIVTPAEHAGDYLETLARLPHSYQINDCDQSIGPLPSRRREGLPDEAFVFACFCVGEKIEREVFGVWMDVLKAVPRSVLWLFGESPTMQKNLKAAAAGHGVDAARLVFASRRTKADHLGRLALADLHFDTGTYGAHTTGSDALWAGVPLVSRLGDTFPSRVGASLLDAIGLPELIVSDWAAYYRLCVDLAHAPQRLAEIKERLERNRRTAPLFDTERSVRDLEALYERMWATYMAGQPPAPIS